MTFVYVINVVLPCLCPSSPFKVCIQIVYTLLHFALFFFWLFFFPSSSYVLPWHARLTCHSSCVSNIPPCDRPQSDSVRQISFWDLLFGVFPTWTSRAWPIIDYRCKVKTSCYHQSRVKDQKVRLLQSGKACYPESLHTISQMLLYILIEGMLSQTYSAWRMCITSAPVLTAFVIPTFELLPQGLLSSGAFARCKNRHTLCRLEQNAIEGGLDLNSGHGARIIF